MPIPGVAWVGSILRSKEPRASGVPWIPMPLREALGGKLGGLGSSRGKWGKAARHPGTMNQRVRVKPELVWSYGAQFHEPKPHTAQGFPGPYVPSQAARHGAPQTNSGPPVLVQPNTHRLDVSAHFPNYGLPTCKEAV